MFRAKDIEMNLEKTIKYVNSHHESMDELGKKEFTELLNGHLISAQYHLEVNSVQGNTTLLTFYRIDVFLINQALKKLAEPAS